MTYRRPHRSEGPSAHEPGGFPSARRSRPRHGGEVARPDEETRRRKAATNPQWPIAHVVHHGVSRDQFMARHKANHVQVAYAQDAAGADKALTAKAALFQRLGVRVHLCGDVNL